MSPFERTLAALAASAAIATFGYFMYDRYWRSEEKTPPEDPVVFENRVQACHQILDASSHMISQCQIYVGAAHLDLNVRGLPDTSQDTRYLFSGCIEATNSFFDMARKEALMLPDQAESRVNELMQAAQSMGQAIIFSPEESMGDGFLVTLNEVRAAESDLRASCRALTSSDR